MKLPCKRLATLGLAGVTCVVLANVHLVRADETGGEIGKPAPEFTLKSTDGKEVSLKEHKGKVVVLEWTNHQCPVVGRYVVGSRKMQETQARFADKGVVWLGIDSSHFCEDVVDAINEFRKKNEINYPTLLDADGKVGQGYGAKTTPHMFVIDKEGVLVYAGSMDDDRYGGSENPRNYVTEAVQAALDGSTVPVSRTRPFGCSVKYKNQQ